MKEPLATIRLSEPIVISQAPADVRGWGPWQFPNIERLRDGRLHVDFHVEKDSVASYGKPVGHALSSDGGVSWERTQENPTEGLKLPDGDRIRFRRRASLPSAGLALPEPLASHLSYGNERRFYPVDSVPLDQYEWQFERKLAGERTWLQEQAQVQASGRLLIEAEGVLAYPILWRMRVAPDGSLWGINYEYRLSAGEGRARFHVVIYLSDDGGRSWREWSVIPYQPDKERDPLAEDREGYSEPDVGFMPDGSVICLIRTTDGHGIAPLYLARSEDNGRTWSRPTYFDDLGVWPCILRLGCGITLAAYGRKGLFVRATADPAGLEWEAPVAVVEPGGYQRDTCSYADMIGVDDHTALIVYSDFQVPGPDRTLRKSIMIRSVHVSAKRQQIPRLTLGTAQLGLAYGIANAQGKPDVTESDRLLNKALDLGVTCFDTARLYGDSEKVLGTFFANRKKPMFITKVKLAPEPGLTELEVERMLRDSLEASLTALRVDQVPVFMLHNTDILRKHAAVVKSTLEAVKREGKIGQAGVSFVADINDTLPPEWEEALDEVYEAVQLPMNVLDQRLIHNGGLKQLYAAGKSVYVRSVFLQGLIFLPEDRLPEALRPATRVISELHSLAREEGISLSQLAISFIRDLPEVDSLVVGAETAEQLVDNMALLQGPSLRASTMQRLLRIEQLPESILNPALWPKS